MIPLISVLMITTKDYFGFDDLVKTGKVTLDLEAAPSIAIPPLNSSARAENSRRINAFSATGGTDLKVNCYKSRCCCFTP